MDQKTPISLPELIQALGEKDVELVVLRRRVRELEQKLQEVKDDTETGLENE